MRIKAYFGSDTVKEAIEQKLGWWDHYDTYGVDIYWSDERDHFMIYGNASCSEMAGELRNVGARIETEQFIATRTPRSCGRPKKEVCLQRVTFSLPKLLCDALRERAEENSGGNASHLLRQILEREFVK